MTLSNPAQYISGRTVQEQMNSLIDYVDARAADVALDAIAADVAQVHQDMLDADADAAAAAASAAAAAGTLTNAVKKTGEASQSIAGDIAVAGALSGGSIATSGAATFGGTTTVAAPVNNTDAATKKYVDDADALKINITDINNYAVGLTGNQTNITGEKTFKSVTAVSIYDYGCGLRLIRRNLDVTQPNVRAGTYIESVDGNGQPLMQIIPSTLGNGKTKVDLLVRNGDGTMTTIELGRGV